MTRLVEAVRALVGTGEHREAMGKHVRLLDALRDALVEHEGLRTAEATCVVCLETGAGREPVCGGCMQIAGDLVKTTTLGLGREATAEEVITALHTPGAADDPRRLDAQAPKEARAWDRTRAIECINEVDGELVGHDKISVIARYFEMVRSDERARRRPDAHPVWWQPERKGGENHLNRPGYEKLVAEDIEWLEKQPRTLERDHIIVVLKASIDGLYPPSRGRSEAQPKAKDYFGRELHVGDIVCLHNDESSAYRIDSFEPAELTIRQARVSWLRKHEDVPQALPVELSSMGLRRAAATPVEPCCYEAPAGIHSENCPTRADETPSPCRRCSECRGENHHWIEECEEPTPEKPDGWAGYVCKHCEARAEMCISCDGAAEPGHVCTDGEDD